MAGEKYAWPKELERSNSLNRMEMCEVVAEEVNRGDTANDCKDKLKMVRFRIPLTI
jgi:hypothetical protein